MQMSERNQPFRQLTNDQFQLGSKKRLQNDMKPKNIKQDEIEDDMDQWDTEENTIKPINTLNKGDNFLSQQKPSQTVNNQNYQNDNSRQQNHRSNIQATQNNVGKFKNYLSNNGNSFAPKNVNIDVTQMSNFKSSQNHQGEEDSQKVQLKPMMKINQNSENVQPSTFSPYNNQQSLKLSTQAASFQSRAYTRALNTSNGRINQVNPKQDEDQMIDPVYKKMFKNLVNARERSPQIGIKTEQIVKRYRNNPDQLKSYFTQPHEEDKQRIREINQKCYDRLMEKGQTYQLKKEILQKYESVAQMKECNFYPKTNRSTSPKRNIEEYARDQEQFMLTKQRKIQEKVIQKEQEEIELQNVNFVCKGSQKLLQNVARYKNTSNPLDISSSLYEQGKSKQLKRSNMINYSQSSKDLRDNSSTSMRDNDKSELFQPKINKKSQMLQRNDSVGNILYQDALDRRKNSKIRQSLSRNRESIHRISQKQSDKYLVQSFKTEYDMAVQRLEIQFQSFEDYIELFRELGFISETNERCIQEQKGLVEDSCISTLFKFSKEKQINVYYLLLAIMNISPLQTKNQDATNNDISSFDIQQQNHENQKLGNNTIYENEEYMYGASNNGSPPYRSCRKDITSILNQNFLDQNNGLLSLNEEQVKIVHKFYLPLYYQRQDFLKIRRKKSTSPQRVEPTFKPSLTQKTVKLADKVLKKLKNQQNHNNSKHFDLLLQKGEEIKQKKNAQLQEKIESEVDSCTFRPQISQTARRIVSSQSSQNLSLGSTSQNSRFIDLYNEHKNKKRLRQDKTSEQIEYEKAMDECTFHPNARGKSNERVPVVKGNIQSKTNSDSHLDQDESGNQINEIPQQITQSPKNKYHREAKPKNSQSIDQQSQIKEENLHTPDAHKDPLYVIAIEIEGQKYQIKIFENDKPEECVRSFFKDKNLSERVLRKIIKMVTEQMEDSNNQYPSQDEIQKEQQYRRPPSSYLSGQDHS